MQLDNSTQGKLDIFEGLLRKWQPKINLISSKDLSDVRSRHFNDSLQLAELIPHSGILYDLGSGGGFPGMVVALAKPELEVSLIESDERKCAFLRKL